MTLKCFQHKGPFVIILHIFLSIKKRDLWLILQPRTYFIFTPLPRLRAKRDVELLVMLWDQTRTQPSSLTGCCYIQLMFSLPPFFYFPMQKSLKIMSRISSAPTLPVIRPRLVSANRTPSAARARSMSRYCWYWARAATHCCRWALWRAWVRVGAPDRGSPHLERKREYKTNLSD